MGSRNCSTRRAGGGKIPAIEPLLPPHVTKGTSITVSSCAVETSRNEANLFAVRISLMHRNLAGVREFVTLGHRLKNEASKGFKQPV